MLAFVTLAQAMTAQVTKDVRPIVNAFESAMAFRSREFFMLNPLIF